MPLGNRSRDAPDTVSSRTSCASLEYTSRRLALEAFESLRVAGETLRQDLDRPFALELRVPCAVHLAHAALAKGCDDLVLAEAGAGGEAQGKTP